MDECEENGSLVLTKKVLSTDDRERLQRRVAQITILRDWKRVGQLLGLGSVVEEIEYNNRDRMSSCVLEMFNKWLKMDTSFSTYKNGLLKLSTTLDMVGENVLASQLKQECGKWNILSLISYSHYVSLIMAEVFALPIISSPTKKLMYKLIANLSIKKCK